MAVISFSLKKETYKLQKDTPAVGQAAGSPRAWMILSEKLLSAEHPTGT